jgi:hypothetical protein
MRQIAKKILLTAATLFFMFGLLPAAVNAEPSQSDPVQLYCESKVPAKARAACQNSGEITRIRNVAGQNCKDVPLDGGQKADCIVKKSKGYIDQANKNPKNPADFTNKLETVLKKNGDPSKSDPSANQGIQTCQNGTCFGTLGSDPDAKCTNGQCDLIKKYVNPTINLLSLCFGVIATGSLIAGGIQYSASVGEPQKVSNAKKRVFNTLLAVVAYLFMYSFLQFIVPGGVFNR